MPAIVFTHLSFHYDTPYAEVFRDVDLLIDSGWRAGLVGRNGRGKTTMLRLITGELSPTAGSLHVPFEAQLFPPRSEPAPGTRTFDVIKDALGPYRTWEADMQGLLEDGSEPAIERYSAIQETYQAAGGYEVDAAIAREFDAMRLAASLLERDFHTLSGGERTRALITSLFLLTDRYPLIDEPTNHLDANGRTALADYLAAKAGFLLVSHDRRFLDRTVDHVASINASDVRVNQGTYAEWKAQIETEELHEARTRDNIERQVRQLKRAAAERRQGAASREADKHSNSASSGGSAMLDTGFIGHRAAKQMRRALNIERRMNAALADKEGLLANREKERELRVTTSNARSDALLTVQNLGLERDGRQLFHDLSFAIEAGERIAITGANGTGKSSLLDIITGDLEPSGGLVSRKSYIHVARSYQIPRWRSGNLRDHLVAAAIDETRFRQMMGVVGVSGDVFEAPLETFSQGQLKKVDLVHSLMSEADLLLWDEPLNYIDVMGREQIESAILDNEPTLLFVEHDLEFVERVATRIVAL